MDWSDIIPLKPDVMYASSLPTELKNMYFDLYEKANQNFESHCRSMQHSLRQFRSLTESNIHLRIQREAYKLRADKLENDALQEANHLRLRDQSQEDRVEAVSILRMAYTQTIDTPDESEDSTQRIEGSPYSTVSFEFKTCEYHNKETPRRMDDATQNNSVVDSCDVTSHEDALTKASKKPSLDGNFLDSTENQPHEKRSHSNNADEDEIVEGSPLQVKNLAFRRELQRAMAKKMAKKDELLAESSNSGHCNSSLNFERRKNKPVIFLDDQSQGTDTDAEEETYYCPDDVHSFNKPSRDYTEDSLGIGISLAAGERTPPRKKMTTSFDRPPEWIDQKPMFAYKESPVRNKVEKANLPGQSCRECDKWWLNIPARERDSRMNQCSKHRGRFKHDVETPESFWNPVMDYDTFDSSRVMEESQADNDK